MIILKSKIFSSDINIIYILSVQILCPKMVVSNKLIVLLLIVSKVVVLVLVSSSPTGLLCFFMSSIFKMLFQVMDKAPPLFICRQVRRTTSRIFKLLESKYWSGLLVFKQRDSKTKLVKEFPLAISLTPYKLSYGMM